MNTTQSHAYAAGWPMRVVGDGSTAAFDSVIAGSVWAICQTRLIYTMRAAHFSASSERSALGSTCVLLGFRFRARTHDASSASAAYQSPSRRWRACPLRS